MVMENMDDEWDTNTPTCLLTKAKWYGWEEKRRYGAKRCRWNSADLDITVQEISRLGRDGEKEKIKSTRDLSTEYQQSNSLDFSHTPFESNLLSIICLTSVNFIQMLISLHSKASIQNHTNKVLRWLVKLHFATVYGHTGLALSGLVEGQGELDYHKMFYTSFDGFAILTY